ncbi:C4-dicarboxylate TRAP transporter substrate-binding protein [Phaeobacter sp. 22II1-1F12B]|uniref:C4-dicarboxylate TRAP transporter substrate-binding protein n=1 Tax=Phaeobacter sp. 22II1-1F12B TaxID=1317111 RepID=UPI000B51E959|nr:C4-dicarboxylate TRAP transporter substrate-binding protein [Phaeobacter sp. 22II1-1F12B]OWU69477.1 hypothetical protein ATO1_24620 [Phaeobacter sp. 22II1-1F12B]
MKFRYVAALVAAAFGTGPAMTSADTFNLTLATGHPEVFPHVAFLGKVFVPEVERLLKEWGSPHSITWLQAYGGTLVKTGSELQALQQGVIDVAFVPTLFSASQLPLEQVTYQAPFISPDDQVIRAAMAKVREGNPAFKEAWDAYGATVLSPGSICDDYNLMLTEPAASLAELEGRRIYAPGPTANWLRDTGMVAVAGNMSEYYQGIQSGIADGVLVLTSAAFPGKYYEVAPHFVKVSLGAQWCSTIAMNTAKLDGLPDDVQTAIKTAATTYSVNLMETVNANLVKHLDMMAENGATMTEWSDEARREWAEAIPNIAQDWAAAIDAKGLPGSDVLKALEAETKALGATPLRDWSE